MSASFEFEKIIRFDENKFGKDFIVGDIHGRFDLVLKSLKESNFDLSVDRLFCVGDLIDRGPYSDQALEFLSLPFVHVVRGNHEDMLLEFYEAYPDATDEQFFFFGQQNGMIWFIEQSEEFRKTFLEKLKELPLVIEIESPRGLVGLVHAEVPLNMSWDKFKEEIQNNKSTVIETALWGRTRLSFDIENEIDGLGRLYVGHTVQKNIKKLANVVAIDTGAVFDRHLSMVNAMCCTGIIEKPPTPQENLLILDNEVKRPFGKVKKS